MRNLKKILALVMALVMSMSLVTIANAADFTDNDDISYEEAADVMNAIGVIEGYEDGSFDPNGTLVREEAATLVTRMLLGSNASNLGIESSSFDDVAMTRWSAPAIEYCVSLGIIDGAGDGNFYPRGQLTAVAFAKVLLTALGYDADTEGLVGTTWSVNTAALAMEVGLDDGIEDLTWNAAITREQAAQMALNTIKAPLVAYEGGVTVVVGDTPVSFGSGDAYYITTTLAREQRISDEQLSNSNDYTVEFGERYFPNLRLNREADEFERPSHTWIYNGDEIGSYTDYDLQVASYTEAITGRDLYDLLGKSTIEDYDIAYYVDGAESQVIKESNMIRTNTRNYSTTDTGVLTQVFVDHTNEEITITSVNTYLAKADADYNETRGELSLTVYDKDSRDNLIERPKTVEVEDIAHIADITEGQFVLVNMAAIGTGSDPYEVVRVNDVESMEDVTVTGYSTGNYVTVDGENIDYAAKAAYDDEVLDEYNRSYLADYTYTLYFDQYDNVIGAEIYEGEANYLFLTGYDINGSNLSVNTATAGAIFLDGEMRTNVQVDVQDTNENIRTYNAGKDADRQYHILSTDGNGRPTGNDDGESEYNRWFRYTVDEDEVYTLTPVSTWVNEKALTDGDEVNCASIRVGTADDNRQYRAYGNEESVYITVDTDAVDYTTQKGISKVNGIYTGVQDVDLKVSSKRDLGLNDGYSVFALYNDDRYIIGAVIVGEDINNSQNYAYILDSEAQEEWREDGTDFWKVDAIVENELVELTIEDYDNTITKVQNALASSAYDRGAMFRVTYNADNHVIGAELCDDAKAYVYGNTEFDQADIDPDTFSVYNVINVTRQRLYLEGRAMYLGSLDDYGLFLDSDAAIFVVQDEVDENGRNPKLTVERFTNAKAALNALALENGDLFSGSVSAVLSDVGTAEYLVINSAIGDSITTDDGTSDSDYGDGYEATFNINSQGYATLRMTVKRPEYVNPVNALPYSFDIYLNGRWFTTIDSEQVDAGETRDTFNSWSQWGFDSTDSLTIENFEFDMDGQRIMVKYVDEHGEDVDMTSGHGTPSNAGNSKYGFRYNSVAGTANFEVDASVYQSGTNFNWSIANATATATSGVGSVGTPVSLTNVEPDGDDYVVITISNLTDVATTYQVSSNDAGALFTGSGMVGTAFEDKDGNASTVPNSIFMVLSGAGFETPTSAQPNVNFSVWVGGVSLPHALAYEVTVNIAGRDYTAVLDGTNNTAANAVSLVTLRLDQNIVIDIEDVTVTPIMQPSLENAIWNGSDNSLTLVFSDPIDASTATAANLGAAGLTLDPSQGTAGISVSGQNVTLYLLNKPANSSTTTITPTSGLENTNGDAFDALKEVTLAVDASGVVTATVADV